MIDRGHEATAEIRALQRVARVMKEEASLLPAESDVTALFDLLARELLGFVGPLPPSPREFSRG